MKETEWQLKGKSSITHLINFNTWAWLKEILNFIKIKFIHKSRLNKYLLSQQHSILRTIITTTLSTLFYYMAIPLLTTYRCLIFFNSFNPTPSTFSIFCFFCCFFFIPIIEVSYSIIGSTCKYRVKRLETCVSEHFINFKYEGFNTPPQPSTFIHFSRVNLESRHLFFKLLCIEPCK